MSEEEWHMEFSQLMAAQSRYRARLRHGNLSASYREIVKDELVAADNRIAELCALAELDQRGLTRWL